MDSGYLAGVKPGPDKGVGAASGYLPIAENAMLLATYY